MAKNNLNLDKVKFFDIAHMRKVAQKYYGIFVKRVTVEGKDYQGNKFPAYKQSYRKLLERDFRTKDGRRYKGYEGQSLTTGGSKISKRVFKLRGITMGPALFKVGKVTNQSIEFVWSGEAGAIVEGNADKGRNIIDGMPKKEEAMLRKIMLEDGFDKEMKKIPNLTVIRSRG